MSSDRLVHFLAHVLPDAGKYIYAYKRSTDRGMQQAVVSSIAELAERVLDLSARGFETYFACSSYTGEPLHAMQDGKPVARYRTGQQVVGTKCLWLDLDCGPDKPYAESTEALVDLKNWCAEYAVPEPTVVISGYGVHAYWVLDRVLHPAEWRQLAASFKAFTNQTELPVDEHRTADIATVLRPPGTNNYKRATPAPVTVGAVRPPVPVAAFAALFPTVAVIERPVQQRIGPDAARQARLLSTYAPVPTSAAKMGQECAWLHENGVVKRGNISEPLWYAMLGVVGHADDGEDMAQRWSFGHPNYDFDETDRKLAQAMANAGPTTCARFESLYFKPCQGCVHRGKITTPLQLGRPQPPTRAALSAQLQAATPADISDAVNTEEIDDAALLAFPYFWQKGGEIACTVYNAEGEGSITDLYPSPVFIDAMRRGELSGIAHAIIRHFAPHDGWQDANVPAGDVTAEGAYRLLGNNHIEVCPPNQKNFTLFLSRSKQDFKDNHKTAIQHETFGWKGDAFLIGETLITPTGMIAAGVSDEIKKFAVQLRPSGTLGAWCGAAQTLFQPGYEHQAMAVLAGFAAPLMRWAPYPGVIYSMISPGSGRGKTFALEASTSIWGAEKCNWISHRDDKVSTGDTLKAQYRIMAIYKNKPVAVDEIRDIDPEKLRAWITAFTDGNPPKGLNRDGSMRKIFGTWQTVMIVTANRSLVDIATSNNDPAAANRVFEVNCALPADADVAKANVTRRTMLENCGNAGIAFVKALLDPATMAWVSAEVAALVDTFTTQLQALRTEKTGGDRYIASFLATITVAGKLLTRLGLLAVNTEHLLAWAFERWGRQRDQIEQAHRTAPELLSAFVREHWMQVIQVETDGRGRENVVIENDQTLRAPIIGRLARDTGMLWLDREAVGRWCFRDNVPLGGLAQELLRETILLNQSVHKNLGSNTQKYRDLGRARCWAVDTRHPALSGELRDLTPAPAPTPLPLRANNGPQQGGISA